MAARASARARASLLVPSQAFTLYEKDLQLSEAVANFRVAEAKLSKAEAERDKLMTEMMARRLSDECPVCNGMYANGDWRAVLCAMGVLAGCAWHWDWSA